MYRLSRRERRDGGSLFFSHRRGRGEGKRTDAPISRSRTPRGERLRRRRVDTNIAKEVRRHLRLSRVRETPYHDRPRASRGPSPLRRFPDAIGSRFSLPSSSGRRRVRRRPDVSKTHRNPIRVCKMGSASDLGYLQFMYRSCFEERGMPASGGSERFLHGAFVADWLSIDALVTNWSLHLVGTFSTLGRRRKNL